MASQGRNRTAAALGALLGLAGLLVPVAAAASERLDEIEALAGSGQTEEALRRLEDLLASRPERFDGQLLRGVLLADLRRTTEAERVFRQLGPQFPERPEPAHNLAVLAAARGRRATAILALEEIVARYPDYETAAANLERIRAAGPAGSFDPLSPDSSRVSLVLSARPGSYRRAELQAETAQVAAPAVEPPPAVPSPATAALPKPASTAAAPAPAAAPPAPAATAPPTLAPAPAGEPAATDELRAELAGLVAAWARAWSEQRVKEYLGFYAAGFRPQGGGSRTDWEALRRQRVAAPAFIEVDIDLDSLTVRQSGPDLPRVTFIQRYRSDRFGDTVEKTLELVREDGAWRILRETSH